MDDNSKRVTVKEDLSCSVCDRKFDRRSRLVAHYKTHTGERPFNCPYCSKTFASKGNCNTHVRVHTRERPYVCQYCDKKFSQHGQMVIHVRRHTGEKPYVCPHCKKGFACSKVLKIHVRTHTGEKPYVCDFCSKGFAAYANLVVHRRIHTRERPYACKLCGRSFEHSGNLVRHERGHHVDGGIRCIPCGRLFQESKDLGVHMNDSHPNDVSKEDLEDQGIDVVSTDTPKSIFTGSAPENMWPSSHYAVQASVKDVSKDINNNTNNSNSRNTDLNQATHKVKEEFRQESPDSGCAIVSDEEEVCKDLDMNQYFLEAGNTIYRRELVQRQLSLLPVGASKKHQSGEKEPIVKNLNNQEMDHVSRASSNRSLVTSNPQLVPLNMSILKSVDQQTKCDPSNKSLNNSHSINSKTQYSDATLNEVTKLKFTETASSKHEEEPTTIESSISKRDSHPPESILTYSSSSMSNSEPRFSSSLSNSSPPSSTEPFQVPYSTPLPLTPTAPPTTATAGGTQTTGGVPVVSPTPTFSTPLACGTSSSLSTVTVLSSMSSAGPNVSSPLTPCDLSIGKNGSTNTGTEKISFSSGVGKIRHTGTSSLTATSRTYPNSIALMDTSMSVSTCRMSNSNVVQLPLHTSPSILKNQSEISSTSLQSAPVANISAPMNLSLHSDAGQNAFHSMTSTRLVNITDKNGVDGEVESSRKRKLSNDFSNYDDPGKCIKTSSSPTASQESPGHNTTHDALSFFCSNLKHKSSVPTKTPFCETSHYLTSSYRRMNVHSGIPTYYGDGIPAISRLPSSTTRVQPLQAKDDHHTKGLPNLAPSSASALSKGGENSEYMHPFGKGVRLSSHIHPVKIRNIRESIRMSVSHICPTQQDKKSFKSNVETALIALLGTSTVAHLAHPNKNAEQVLVILLDLVGMAPCADVRVDEDERLRVNMRKLLEYGFPEPSAWRSLGWYQETIETIIEKIAMWSITKQWRQSRDLASSTPGRTPAKYKAEHADTSVVSMGASRLEVSAQATL